MTFLRIVHTFPDHAVTVQRDRCRRSTAASTAARGTNRVRATLILVAVPGTHSVRPAFMASHPARATSSTGSFRSNLKSRVWLAPARVRNGVRNGPGHRHVTVTPVPLVSH